MDKTTSFIMELTFYWRKADIKQRKISKPLVREVAISAM